MEKLKSIEELKNLRDEILAEKDPTYPTIIISAGTCGQASGANGLIRVTKRELLARGTEKRINVRITGCNGFCEMEPSVLIKPLGTFYPKVGLEDMARIVDAVGKGMVLESLLYKDPMTGKRIEKQDDVPFFKGQTRTILSRNEDVDPIRIHDYIENGGYNALAKVLAKGDPSWIISEVKKSGLRGRGGAGFPTGLKWEFLSKQPGNRGKFIVCNADEGDPGAYMDRCVLEGNPHSIIEGMIIGAYATEATNGVIYVRHEYPLAIKHLIIALRQAREISLLGKNILGSSFSFDIELVRGAGAFVCGEETALMSSIEGKIGEPRQRPPFPVQRGIDGKPTAINNVETWANIPIIIEFGADKFARVGTRNNSGTKIFSLVGKIKNTGLVEIPMGASISEVVNSIGGGPAGDAKIKAIQTGGPSGGCIPAGMFDLPIDYDSLTKAGSIMGSGGMIVMDENTCMVDVAKYFMKFLKDESCGKCFICRKGTQRMYEILEEISDGRGTLEHLNLLEELALVVKDTSMCGLGQSAPNPVLSTLRYFRHEYERHILQKRCDAFVCTKLVGTPCQSACPLGTEAWRYIALIEKGEYEEAYKVIRETNPFPSVCARVCDHPCESRCRLGQSGSRSVAIRALKRFVTDTVDPSVYKPKAKVRKGAPKIAVVGAGPAGLTAAHYLSLKGYKVTVFEAENEAGGMLMTGVPEYRLPREIMKKEIKSLLDKNITLKFNTAFGKDISVDSLFGDGYKAVFLALGAHRSRRLGLDGEDANGVCTSMEFLRAFNLRGEKLAKKRVGVIGGGNSAVDAARVALRQEGVESVTIYYRRSRKEMPAFPEEIEAAIEEGVRLEPLVSPVKLKIEKGKLRRVEFVKNELGEIDLSGRATFRALPGIERMVELDTLIIAIGEQTYPFSKEGSQGVEMNKKGMIVVDFETLATGRLGVFAGGDAITGPSSVVNAISAGKRVALIIDRYLNDEDLRKPIITTKIPGDYITPSGLSEEELEKLRRVEPPKVPMEKRRKSFVEVEMNLSRDDAACEARRCLRCDLEFTQAKVDSKQDEKKSVSQGGRSS